MSDILPTVSLVNGIPKVSSLEIAERFGKQHKNVMRDIERLLADLDNGFRELNFELTFRIVPGPNNSQREEPYYNLTRDAFSLLAMGFTGKKALAWKVKYIEAFNLMEARLLKRSHAKKRLEDQQKALPTKDKYEAYIEDVEAFRAKTQKEIDRLLNKGMDLVDFCKFGPDGIAGFTPILIDWLQNVAGQHVPLMSDWQSMERAIEYSPLCLMKRLEAFLPDRFTRQ